MILVTHIASSLTPFLQSNLFTSMLWIIAAFTLLFIETAFPGFFFFISFACGCFAASLLALCHAPFLWQLIAWLGTTIISFFILKKLGNRVQPNHYHSNYDALIGKRGTVTQEIKPLKMGRVKVQNESWAAQAHHETISVGESVQILEVKGNKVIVQTIRKVSP